MYTTQLLSLYTLNTHYYDAESLDGVFFEGDLPRFTIIIYSFLPLHIKLTLALPGQSHFSM